MALDTKEKMKWYMLIVATIVLGLLVIASLFGKYDDLNEVFIFFGSICALVLGAGIYSNLKK